MRAHDLPRYRDRADVPRREGLRTRIFIYYQHMRTMKTPTQASCEVPPLEFRAYAVKELATLYFPHCEPGYAGRCLRRLIRRDPELLRQLQERGYRTRAHYLPPVAVQVLLEHLGTPQDFYAILRKS